ncbi:hypothetical protein MIB92_19825 [Aestuariirhabdus sp. Z084]|uniref:hypothetical protein n=1 Tax=Aestuariirhabdus haliotis TaxID=2918751 RepID=UPI00201B370E|nr:hypothetical protein [Aestuariirhabdus haliotis]MCL6417907.1 hypothetical protein [Aestuariirhabdus haliotis]MCL6421761.1 hypothetical protein [Aestuariirhabdus haliotis]
MSTKRIWPLYLSLLLIFGPYLFLQHFQNQGWSFSQHPYLIQLCLLLSCTGIVSGFIWLLIRIFRSTIGSCSPLIESPNHLPDFMDAGNQATEEFIKRQDRLMEALNRIDNDHSLSDDTAAIKMIEAFKECGLDPDDIKQHGAEEPSA